MVVTISAEAVQVKDSRVILLDEATHVFPPCPPITCLTSLSLAHRWIWKLVSLQGSVFYGVVSVSQPNMCGPLSYAVLHGDLSVKRRAYLRHTPTPIRRAVDWYNGHSEVCMSQLLHRMTLNRVSQLQTSLPRVCQSQGSSRAYSFCAGICP